MSSVENNLNINSEITDIIELKVKIKELKRDRLNINKETGLLKNRLNLLRSEEEKTWKKIEMTRNKTHEKISQINHHYQKQEAKRFQTLKEDNDFEQRYIQATKIRVQRDARINEKKNKDNSISDTNEVKAFESRKETMKIIQKDKNEEHRSKRKQFKKIKQEELDMIERRKLVENDRKIRNQHQLIEKMDKIDEDLKSENKRINEYENEEMDILKRMQKSTVMLASMSSYLKNLSCHKGKTQFAQNPYKSLLDNNATVLVRKNSVSHKQRKKSISNQKFISRLN
mmetsp:Transcript_1895/g.1932  ORF Transcript_1895/g.1932 Transcript_1895/m.1932 type:complete len:285 (-) Transcript_1895:19-873(-)